MAISQLPLHLIYSTSRRAACAAAQAARGSLQPDSHPHQVLANPCPRSELLGLEVTHLLPGKRMAQGDGKEASRGWDRMGRHGTAWDGMAWDEMGWHWMGWDGIGWDGMGQGCSALSQSLLAPNSCWSMFVVRIEPGTDKCSFSHQAFPSFQTSVLSHAGCHASDEPPVSIPKEPKCSLRFSAACTARLLLCFSERTSCYWYCLVVSPSPHPSVSICCDPALLTSFLG